MAAHVRILKVKFPIRTLFSNRHCLHHLVNFLSVFIVDVIVSMNDLLEC